MDFNKFTIKSQEAVQQAQELVQSNGNSVLDTGHLLKGILLVDDGVLSYLFQKMEVNQSQLEMVLDRILAGYPKVTGAQLSLSSSANTVFNNALKEMNSFKDDYVSLEVLFYAMLTVNDAVGQLLKDLKITQTKLKEALMFFIFCEYFS